MRRRFKNRHEAGRELAGRLEDYAKRSGTIVLGLARGGVPVAFEVAEKLELPLEAFIVREIPMPRRPEVSVGAVASGGVLLLDEDLSSMAEGRSLQDAIESEDRELAEQEAYYRVKHFPEISDRTVLLVDDGLTSKACMRAAVDAICRYRPSCLILAAPAAADIVCDTVRRDVDEVVILAESRTIEDVRRCYEDLTPPLDEEVAGLLHEHASSTSPEMWM